MRRIVALFFVVSLHGWSQPAPQQVHPPLIVQGQPPPESIWIILLKYAIPTVLVVGSTLSAVWLTNRNNETVNAASRAHQLELERLKADIAAQAKNRDNRWEFRKASYVRIVTAVLDLNRTYSVILTSRQARLSATTDEIRRQELEINNKACLELSARYQQYHIALSLSRLATADAIFGPSIRTEAKLFAESTDKDSDYDHHLQEQICLLEDFLREVFIAARKDLWDKSEAKTKVDTHA